MPARHTPIINSILILNLKVKQVEILGNFVFRERYVNIGDDPVTDTDSFVQEWEYCL